MNARVPRQNGFTLVELLVASAILVVLGVAGYAGLDIVLGSSERTAAHSERLDQLQRGFTWFAMDLEQVVRRPIRDELGDEQPALSFAAGVDSLEFTRAGWPNPAQQPRSTLQRVAYAVERGRLMRIYWRELDRLQGTEPVRRVLVDEVAGLSFRFMDAQREWHEQWPPLAASSVLTSAMPLAVEIVLRLDDWGELRRVYALPG